MNNVELGKLGEDTAERYLKEKGYYILCRNYRCKRGEIDIVAQKGDVVHFVEVKTRQQQAFGSPAESIKGGKLARMRAAAGSYLSAANGMPGLGRRYQFDALEVGINHIENI